MSARTDNQSETASGRETIRTRLRAEAIAEAPGVVRKGSSAPLGAIVYPGGVNFSVFSKNATLIELLLFGDETAAKPAKIISLDPNRHRTSVVFLVLPLQLATQNVSRVEEGNEGTPCRDEAPSAAAAQAKKGDLQRIDGVSF